jgi:hypothetical protein
MFKTARYSAGWVAERLFGVNADIDMIVKTEYTRVALKSCPQRRCLEAGR